MKPPLIVAILLITLAIAGVLIISPSDPGTVGSRPEPSDSASVASAEESSTINPPSQASHDDASAIAPGRVFRCTVESLDRARLLDDGDELTMEERAQRDEERFDAFVERLSVSGDLNHRLTVGLLQAGKASPLAIETLAPLLTSMPENELVHWRLLEACDVRPTHPVCENGRAEARSIAVLGSNGEMWAKIAYFRAKHGDRDGALQALRNAASADEIRDFWGHEVALMFDSLSIEADYAVPERLVAAIGVSAALIGADYNLVRECQNHGADLPAWREACIAYGARKEQEGETLIGRGIGISLQAAMYTLNGDEAAADEVRRRELPVMDMFRDPINRDGEVLLMTDDSIALAWLEHLRTYGELSARGFLRTEVERVSRIPGYDPCPPREPRM